MIFFEKPWMHWGTKDFQRGAKNHGLRNCKKRAFSRTFVVKKFYILFFFFHLSPSGKAMLLPIPLSQRKEIILMKTFLCNRLRMCTYLMDRGFHPAQVLPDADNPRYSVFLFDETPELAAAIQRYFTADCLTARLNNERKDHHEHFEEEQHQRI